MAEQIDIESALEDAIFELNTIEDVYDIELARSRVTEVLDEMLRPALAAVQANEKRIKALLNSLEAALTASTIDRIATPEAKQDPGVMPVLQKIEAKVRMPNVPEFGAADSVEREAIRHHEQDAAAKLVERAEYIGEKQR